MLYTLGERMHNEKAQFRTLGASERRGGSGSSKFQIIIGYDTRFQRYATKRP